MQHENGRLLGVLKPLFHLEIKSQIPLLDLPTNMPLLQQHVLKEVKLYCDIWPFAAVAFQLFSFGEE